jgi:flagellar basal body-associated protein FliL
MKTIWKIIIGIPSAAAAIAIIGGLYLYFDSIRNKPLNKEEVKEIVKEQNIPVLKSLDDLWFNQGDILNNQDLMKKLIVELIKKDKKDSIEKKVDRVTNFLYDWRTTDLKKNWNLSPIVPKPYK